MKLDLKLISLMLILFFISLSAVSAEDMHQIDNDLNEIETNNSYETLNTIDEAEVNDLTANTNSFSELSNQIKKAQAGDTIELDADYISEGDAIRISKSITLDGKGHTLDANHYPRAIIIPSNTANVVIKNIVFINGESITNGGGALFANTGSYNLIIDNCTFKNNKAPSGGAIYINQGDQTTITNCRFENNNADNAGAIDITGTSPTLTNNYITQCSAVYDAGAVRINGESPTLTNNKFIDNTAGELAGALLIKTNNSNIKNNEFTGNTAGTYHSGGAIYIEGENNKLEQNNFTNNQANVGGAVIYTSNTKNGEVIGNTFKNNYAKSGGAVYAEGTKITISENTFNNNKATTGAGGSLNIKTTTAIISDNDITKSYSKESGGAIYLESKTIRLTNNQISQCNAGSNAAATYINGASSVNIIGNRFVSNTAGQIAGALFIKTNKATIKNNEFAKNTAPSSGGAIRIEGDSNVISNNTFTENKATGVLGGAICSLGHNNQFTYNTFTDNVAGRDGGAILSEGTNVADIGHNNIISNNVFTGNKVTGNAEGSHGGAISMAGESCAINYNNFTNNHADTIGGAIRWNGGNSAMGDIIGNIFESNDAPSGGAMYITGHGINVAKNTFNNNKATNAGGSIDIVGNNAIISDNKISNSDSQKIGGGIYAKGENTQFKGNTLTRCSAENNGGGAYLEGSGTVSNSKFTSCSAKNNGGGIFFTNTNYKLEGTTFKDNTATNAANYYPTSIPNTKLSTKLTVTDITAAYGSNQYITATLKDTKGNPISGESLIFENNGVKNTITTDADGNARYYTNELEPGSYNIKVTFDGTDAYNAATSVTSKVTITKADISISALYNDTDKEIIATLTNDVTGNAFANADVKFDINGVVTTVKSDSEGQAIASVDLPTGTYTAIITYAGNTKYNPASTNITFDAKADTLNTTLTVDDVTTTYNSGANIKATLKDENSNAVSDAEITFKIGSTTLTAITDAEGVAAVSVDGINPNTYNANIVFSGNDDYNGANATATVTISKANTTIDAPDTSVAYTDKNGAFIATLINYESGKAISGVTVVVNINGTKQSLKTDSNGQVKVSTADWELGNYTAIVTYAGNTKYNKANATANIDVSKADIIISPVYNAANKKLTATLTNNVTGTALVNAKVTFDLNGAISTVQTNSNGQATISTENITSDTCTAIITYAGNTKYNPASTNITFSTKMNVDISAVYDIANTQIVATLTNNDTGKTITNINVKFDLNGKITTVKTNTKGQAKLSTKDLKTGTYTAIITYAGNTKYNPASTNITFSTKIDTTISAVYDAANSEIIATLTNAEGKALSSANVKVNFNGETTTVKTNTNGQVKISTAGLPLGTYPATFSYAGNSKYNAASTSINVEIKTKVIVTDVYAYSDRIVAKLTNGATGKTIANANMIVEINGVKYNAKSDNKGQLTFDTTGLDLPSSYDLTISYRGNDRYTASSATVAVDLNKANMMITTNYHADKQKMVATLKNSITGKAVSNANMIIELNGVKTTYKSNDQGKITLPTADFAPGTYVGTVTYPGNARYNSISAVFKIDI